MPLTRFHLLIFLIGLLTGAGTAWLWLRARQAQAIFTARAASESEHRLLAEQLRGQARDVDELRARWTQAESRVAALQVELSSREREVAQLGERAGRLPELEAGLVALRELADKSRAEAADWRERAGRHEADLTSARKRVEELDAAQRHLASDRETLLREHSELSSRIAMLSTTLDKERSQSQEKLGLLHEAREQLSLQFKSLANEILDEKSRKFAEQNQVSLGHLLDPLQERIKSFQTKVEEVYVNESKDRSALHEQVRMLAELNSTLNQQTQDLTHALKGDRKAQGNWGEIILDEVLQKAGLLPGRHYDRQPSVKSEDGQTHVIPDVVLRFPGENERHLVIDSKFTTPDYRVFADADNEADRQLALKRHLASISAHMKGLSEKNYQSLYGLKSMDFVVMFVPLEPAFMLAVTHDRELFQQAWERNVLLVSPSTLLFVVRTIAHLWRQEDLGRNAREISSRGAELYDKLVGFVNDLQRVGKSIEAAQAAYGDARRKFSEGSGNLIGQADKLRKLGVKPSKKLPPGWSDAGAEGQQDTLAIEDGGAPDAPRDPAGASGGA